MNAIFRYHLDCFYDGTEVLVDYADMEDCRKTYFRFWDWTNKRILPEEKMEVIERFIV
jgi:hypothetical protein